MYDAEQKRKAMPAGDIRGTRVALQARAESQHPKHSVGPRLCQVEHLHVCVHASLCYKYTHTPGMRVLTRAVVASGSMRHLACF